MTDGEPESGRVAQSSKTAIGSRLIASPLPRLDPLHVAAGQLGIDERMLPLVIAHVRRH
jgi:hypothetical protein